MNRVKEEKAIKELNIAVSKLLECYQWDHLPADYKRAVLELVNIRDKLVEVERLLYSENEEKE